MFAEHAARLNQGPDAWVRRGRIFLRLRLRKIRPYERPRAEQQPPTPTTICLRQGFGG